jgi:DNA helicase II / ATP-dependent DNA helicase PcrA
VCWQDVTVPLEPVFPEQLSADAVLEGLDPEQRDVATTLHGPLCVLAGAGTGKTRAITHRIAYGVRSGVYNPAQVLAVTFTARAAGEMRGRLRELAIAGVQARTFHAAALRQLQYFWPRAIGGPMWELLDHKAGFIGEAGQRQRHRLDRTAIRDVATELEWAKVSQITPEKYPAAAAQAGRIPPAGLDAAAVSRIYESYETLKRDRGRLDFEDVLLFTVGILEEHGDVAETVRAQYRHFVVDEYQDVNPLQQRLLDAWLGDRSSVCVVGDASQTIYAFTGASSHHLLEFSRRYPDATTVRLVRSYRSTPQVVAMANRVLADAAPQFAASRLELIAQRPAGPEPERAIHADDTAEADAVATRARNLIRAGLPAHTIAVLLRTNAQSEAFEQALAAADVPYVVRGGDRFFARPEVKQAVMLLRGAARAGTDETVEPSLGEAETRLGHEVRAVLSSVGWTAEPVARNGATRDRWESLAAVVRLADGLAAGHPTATLAELVTELAERAQAQHAPTVDGVTIASLHAAKGLEWDVVFLPGLSEGLMPISYADTPAAVEEERRLLYVGVTRARQRVALSWARSRHPGGRSSRSPSRFLTGLWPDSGHPAAAQRNGARRTGKKATGSAPSSVSPANEALFERLRQWRAEQAQQASVPAYVVFTDATLTAIAENRPASRAELAVIAGVGAVKLDRYGADVIELCHHQGHG